jgi:hypothetical protein
MNRRFDKLADIEGCRLKFTRTLIDVVFIVGSSIASQTRSHTRNPQTDNLIALASHGGHKSSFPNSGQQEPQPS